MSQAVLTSYLTEIEKAYKTGKATEHTYRPALRDLLESKDLLESEGTDITALNEPKRVKCGAPDYVVENGNLTIGYVEAKDIGISLDKIEKDEQLKRYRNALNNLVLTDYLEFRWYVDGEKRMTATLATPGKGKSLTLDKVGAKQVEELLTSFLQHSAEAIRKPQELAKRMARLAHMIRDIIIDAFNQRAASQTLKDLYTAFQQVLLPELIEPDFADMFAQTLAYGLFAARYNHDNKKPFSRNDAAKEIPRTNPFLRRLFGAIAGPDLDDEPFVGFVDELAQVLAYTDMDAVLADFGKHTRAEDPIVHFYETFLAQYDPKLRELRGVYYTPDPVVSYIVRSVDALLRTHFDCADGLADTGTVTYSYTDEEGKKQSQQMPRVLILDPATGTATFPYHVIAHIRDTYRQMGNAGMWSSYVREHLLPRLFGFELLIAPYAMAHLKLGMQLAAIDLPKEERATWAYDFQGDERLGIYLTNTLDGARKRSNVLFGRYISDEANEASQVKQGYPVMVVLGNPPYSGHSANRSWKKVLNKKTNKEKIVPTFIGELLREYFQVDGVALGERNPKWLQDDYVKFIRFAQWRIEQTGYGILAFITNHGYLSNLTFRGMRQSLVQSFDDIYILDLHGNSKKKERPPDEIKDENVFDIQQGVAIGIFVKRRQSNSSTRKANVYHIDLWGEREVYKKVGQETKLAGGKYNWLAENDISTTEWRKLNPNKPFYFFMPQNENLSQEYDNGTKITDALSVYTVGLTSGQDAKTIAFTEEEAQELASSFGIDQDITKRILYRPFDRKFIVYAKQVITRPRTEVMRHMLAGKNLAIATTRSIEIGRGWEHVLCSEDLVQLHTVSLKEINYMFPLYLYPDPKQNGLFEDPPTGAPGGRRPNLAPDFTQKFSAKLNLQFIQDGRGDLQATLGPENIFNYMYAVFHSPSYRERYAEFLKIDFPRLPLTSNIDLFRELCKFGGRLVELHLMEKFGKITTRFPEPGNNLIEKVAYTVDPHEPEKGRVWINKTQYIEGVPPEVWEFHIGGYQVCEKWLKDRKSRQFTHSDFQHYQRIVAALAETITLMEQIDEAIEEHGGWPIQ